MVQNISAPRGKYARHFQRRSSARRWTLVAACVACLGIFLWLVFWSPLLSVTDIRVEGSAAIVDTVQEQTREFLDTRFLAVLRPARSILFLNTDAVSAHLLAVMPALERVTVTKEYPHAITLTVIERVPTGVWCKESACQYIDAQGARWGDAPRSHGQLLLLIDDDRSDATDDERMFAGIRTANQRLRELGIPPAWVILPDTAPGDMTVQLARGYDIRFNTFGDMADQLSTLEVFLADRAHDDGFHPTYIDLRTPGRVYFK